MTPFGHSEVPQGCAAPDNTFEHEAKLAQGGPKELGDEVEADDDGEAEGVAQGPGREEGPVVLAPARARGRGATGG